MPDAGWRERTVSTNGVELHVLEAGDTGPLVVLAHGFPELAYSWRHQLPALAAAGYRVVAPDMRGYGRSSRPEPVEDYDVHQLSADLIGLVDDAGEDKAVFVGHDWGSIVTWNLALLHADRAIGVAGLSVPFVARPPRPPTVMMRETLGDAFFYMLYFQEPGVADADLGRDPGEVMRRMMGSGGRVEDDATFDPTFFANDGRGFVERLPEPKDTLPHWLCEAELDHFIGEFERTGFTGGINWYRNFDRNWATTEHLAGAKVEMPSLFVGGTRDPVLLLMPPSGAHDHLSDHRGDVYVADAGHWLHQEKPAEVNAALIGFLDDICRTEH